MGEATSEGTPGEDVSYKCQFKSLRSWAETYGLFCFYSLNESRLTEQEDGPENPWGIRKTNVSQGKL